MKTETLGIYIHVPFCGKKCGYCDFYSVCYNKKTADDYISAVLRNIRHYSDRSHIVDTIYFGGGTPSLLTAKQICDVIEELKQCFILFPDAEITLEANPNTLNPQKLSDLKNAGVNRLSIGVQSFDDKELKLLGRTHSAERAEKAVRDAFAAGFENISCDLMLAIPNQTAVSLEGSVSKLASLNVQHVSAYLLKIEQNTPFCENGIAKLCPDEDETAELYLKSAKLLERYGFMQYEISNFAKKGFESRHNCRYWMCSDYLGIGPSAHSCCGGKRFAVKSSVREFIESNVQPTYITDDSPYGFEEYAMLRLRLKKGLDLSETGEHREKIEKKIPRLVKAGYAEYDGRFISLTAKGFLMSNSIIEFLIFED